jgi:hypothetical protein
MTKLRSLRPVGVRLLGQDEIQMYEVGGKGRFILKSTKTETSYEYKIKRPSKTIRSGYGKPQPNPKYDENILWVTVKTDSSFSFMGCIRIEENDYYHSKKSNIDINDKRVKGIKWLLNQFENDSEFPSEMEFHHMGVCGCCSRGLTTPGSIKMGIGPICFEKYGSERLKKLLILKKKLEKKMKENKIVL